LQPYQPPGEDSIFKQAIESSYKEEQELSGRNLNDVIEEVSGEEESPSKPKRINKTALINAALLIQKKYR
jgi:hypothetical protein